ncbi:amidase [Verticiella sediminum]|uniref:Amidase n=1 Tax=Verticiella sediminum TaxID=1247510 RepID=A0A556ARJ1_9BURK|nr:amidase [Verticiella sediminum]TSH95550.1 amidase [Verticiella sediminum]
MTRVRRGLGLHDGSARECAAAVARGELGAREVASHFIGRVQAVNPGLNAIVQFDPADVLAQADRVQARLAAGEVLPMAGVPVTIKDNLWVEGYTITQGSRLYADFVAPRDAWSVARLRDLGALILGITNCSEFACKGTSDNLVYGATRHPADAELTPGGSSGGAAAALARGLGLLALGTDAGGSVRRPAAHTGLVGLKPSQGLIPHPWGFGEPNYGVSVVGILARNAADCAWAFDHLAHFDASDASAPALEVDWQALAATRVAPPRALRLAWSPRLGCDFAIDADVLAGVERQVDRLREQGWEVAEADPPWRSSVREYALDDLQHAGLHALYGDALARAEQDVDPVLAAQIVAGAHTSTAQRADLLRARARIARDLERFFLDHDVLLCPSVPVLPWPYRQLGPTVIGGMPAGPRGHAVYTPLFNLCGVPACSVPAGTVRGLPVGLQIVAPRFEDVRVLQMAAYLESLSA